MLLFAQAVVVVVMHRRRRGRRRPKQQPPTALRRARDPVYPAGLGEPAVLAAEDVAVDAALQAVLVVGEGVEAEVEQALAVALADDDGREQVPEKALLVVRVRRVAEEALEGPEGSQLGGVSVDARELLGSNSCIGSGKKGRRVVSPLPCLLGPDSSSRSQSSVL